MFLGHARPTRLAVVYLLFTVALLLVPKADISETPFDEANTPTNEIVVTKAASSWEHLQSVTAFVPRIFAQPRRSSVCRIFPVYAGRLTDSRTVSGNPLFSPLLVPLSQHYCFVKTENNLVARKETVARNTQKIKTLRRA
jgi:hypothetical protein